MASLQAAVSETAAPLAVVVTVGGGEGEGAEKCYVGTRVF
jgi:hypothetical protein